MNFIHNRHIIRALIFIFLLFSYDAVFSIEDVDISSASFSVHKIDIQVQGVEAGEEIKVPELLTPNGDGRNDKWEIIGIEKYQKTKVTIFNRRGNKVYEMDQYNNNWGGKSNTNLALGGSELPAGTYYYVLELDNTSMKGFLFIAR